MFLIFISYLGVLPISSKNVLEDYFRIKEHVLSNLTGILLSPLFDIEMN